MEFLRHHRTLTAIHNRAYANDIKAGYYYWSAEAIDILYNNYGKLNGLDICCKLLPMYTRQGIDEKARKLGLNTLTDYNKPITAEELALIKQYYPTEGINVAARLPGRSIGTIRATAYKYNLHVAKRKTMEMKQVLCIETGTVYNSIHDASAAVGSDIHKALTRSKTGFACGYHWKYVEEGQE